MINPSIVLALGYVVAGLGTAISIHGMSGPEEYYGWREAGVMRKIFTGFCSIVSVLWILFFVGIITTKPVPAWIFMGVYVSIVISIISAINWLNLMRKKPEGKRG